MTEKTRSIIISGGGGGGGVGGIGASVSGGNGGGLDSSLIGAPTLISSTFTSSSSPSTIVLGNTSIHGSSITGTGTSNIIGNSSSMVSHSCHNNNTNNGLGAGGNDTDSDIGGGQPLVASTGATVSQFYPHHVMYHDLLAGISGTGSGESNSIMNSSQISTTSSDSTTNASKSNKHVAAHNVAGKNNCRFPKLEECAHFHYERVQLGPFSVRLVDDKSELLNNSIASQSIGGDVANSSLSSSIQIHASRLFSPRSCSFFIKVMPNRTDPFIIKRSFDNIQMLDEMLHRCVYDRKISGLKELALVDFKTEDEVEYAVANYLERFSKIASDSLTCGTILTWFQLDNKGRRLPLADTDTMRSINTPAVGAAYGVRRYVAQACDEISIEVGDMISVIDMPSPAESIWWRGKKSHLQKSHYEVGFFPQSCVATIGDKVPRHFPLPAPLVGQLDVSPTKPVLRKHGKLIAFFRSFILSRPSRRRLKQSGIYRERVFSCDLSEHLLNSGQEIPMVLKCCSEFIEEHGIVDGIYRLSGITSNIQKLRRAFDEERVPELTHPEIRQDIHAVSSLLKMYFRELPNPLCTYQLYDNFVEAIQAKSESNERLRLMKETVLKLPPPHYRTLKYLATHLNKISQHSARTGMTDKNLAIVWAPNLLRSPALESGGVAALRGVGVQAVVTEYLIRNCNLIFEPSDEFYRSSYAGDQRMDSLTDCESLLIEQREHDQSLSFIERPKSLTAGGAKLISLEEAQERHSRSDDINKSIPINAPSTAANIGSYIEVGGGPSSLPDKYHTVLPVPRSWQKRKTHSWKSLFTRNPRNSNSNNDIKTMHVSMPEQKEPPPCVTFAEDDGSDQERTPKQEKPKSIDLFDCKPMEICVRSSSIDSLRTAGHSRSVSHDSYFDLLQSPLRGMTTCLSRELSELGMNFDREEPEMRIFSESESLVSSPKVGKENVPPTRRVLRARPEEFSSTTNSVNPSPKKQPRLNLLSPSDCPSSWNPKQQPCPGINHTDESCCKRYKLEDQLSDIQYIDCSTPEHVNVNPNTVYTSVQIHNPPSSVSKSSSFNSDNQDKKPTNASTTFESIFENKDKAESSHIITRYSYPTVQVGAKRKDNDAALKERFSYPGTANTVKYVCRMPTKDLKMNIEEERKAESDTTPSITRVSFLRQQPQTNAHSKVIDNLKAINRYSYCDLINDETTNPALNYLLRNCSTDVSKKEKNEMERSKLSVTPSSPMQSPRYSLLVGETSSENSSAVVTPVFEMDPLVSITSSHQDECQHSNDNDNHCQKTRNSYDDTKDFSNNCGRVSLDSLSSNLTSQNSHNVASEDKRDINAVKRELSLDLEVSPIRNGTTDGGCSKMSVDLTDMSVSSNNKNLVNIPPSPNNSNFTHTSDNTSQSVTPSEFGYQHLQRQSNPVSLENSPNLLNSYDNLANAFSNYDRTDITPTSSTKKASSPIKSTISITYNLKSPTKGDRLTEYEPNSIGDDRNSMDRIEQEKHLLETSFDENMVYEQVKFFRNSVTEVNQLLNNGNQQKITNNLSKTIEKDEFNNDDDDEPQIVPDLTMDISPKEENSNNLIDLSSPIKETFINCDDILMNDNIDSLEIEQNFSLYENVELRKPPTVYENIDISNSIKTDVNNVDKQDLDSLEKMDKKPPTHQRTPSNFSVKQLATKFELSPVEPQPPFDFNIRNSKKFDSPKSVSVSSNKTQQQNKNLNKSLQITRSLDENAFVREFGPKSIEDHEVTKSSQQIEKIDDGRRKSFDFTRPKSLNPPKRLPGMPISEENIIDKPLAKLKLDLQKVEEAAALLQAELEDIKITPTTENRISLIQNNVDPQTINDNGMGNNIAGGIKVLSGVKLDREKIERIKEERRHQLKEKYRTESFKSKSKIELREFPKDEKFQSESLRVKSKSRGDVRSLPRDNDNVKGSDIMQFSNRIRRISDEKNQNNCESISPPIVVGTIPATNSHVPTNKHPTSQINNDDDFSAKVTAQKFERKSIDFVPRERELATNEVLRNQPLGGILTRNSISSTREKISPQFSIRDVTAMFESRSQNQQ